MSELAFTQLRNAAMLGHAILTEEANTKDDLGQDNRKEHCHAYAALAIARLMQADIDDEITLSQSDFYEFSTTLSEIAGINHTVVTANINLAVMLFAPPLIPVPGNDTEILFNKNGYMYASGSLTWTYGASPSVLTVGGQLYVNTTAATPATFETSNVDALIVVKGGISSNVGIRFYQSGTQRAALYANAAATELQIWTQMAKIAWHVSNVLQMELTATALKLVSFNQTEISIQSGLFSNKGALGIKLNQTATPAVDHPWILTGYGAGTGAFAFNGALILNARNTVTAGHGGLGVVSGVGAGHITRMFMTSAGNFGFGDNFTTATAKIHISSGSINVIGSGFGYMLDGKNVLVHGTHTGIGVRGVLSVVTGEFGDRYNPGIMSIKADDAFQPTANWYIYNGTSDVLVGSLYYDTSGVFVVSGNNDPLLSTDAILDINVAAVTVARFRTPHGTTPVNYLEFRGGLTASPAIITTQGETNVSLSITTKGTTGAVLIQDNPNDYLGFFGTANAQRQTVSGSRSGATVAVLASLLAGLDNYNLISDNTTA